MKWDYLTINIDRKEVGSLENILDECGKAGWELIHIFQDRKLIFKKPLEEEVSRGRSNKVS